MKPATERTKCLRNDWSPQRGNLCSNPVKSFSNMTENDRNGSLPPETFFGYDCSQKENVDSADKHFKQGNSRELARDGIRRREKGPGFLVPVGSRSVGTACAGCVFRRQPVGTVRRQRSLGRRRNQDVPLSWICLVRPWRGKEDRGMPGHSGRIQAGVRPRLRLEMSVGKWRMHDESQKIF